MKKYFSVVLVIVAAIFSSCEKDDYLTDISELNDSEIVIKTTQDGEVQSVMLNDTLAGKRNVKTIFWTESGESVHWHIIELSSHNYGLTHDSFEFGSQIDFKFKHHGIYVIILREYDCIYSSVIHQFYIKIEGKPGIIGDGPENDYIFRMEVMEDISGNEHLFIYYKFTDDYLEHFMYNNEYNQFTMNKFIYSDEPYYYYQIPIISGNYELKFMKLIEGVNFLIEDANMKYSSYYVGNNWLEFFIP